MQHIGHDGSVSWDSAVYYLPVQVILEGITELHLIICLGNELLVAFGDGVHGRYEKEGRVAAVSFKRTRYVYVFAHRIILLRRALLQIGSGLLVLAGIVPYTIEHQRVNRPVA